MHIDEEPCYRTWECTIPSFTNRVMCCLTRAMGRSYWPSKKIHGQKRSSRDLELQSTCSCCVSAWQFHVQSCFLCFAMTAPAGLAKSKRFCKEKLKDSSHGIRWRSLSQLLIMRKHALLPGADENGRFRTAMNESWQLCEPYIHIAGLSWDPQNTAHWGRIPLQM